MTDRCPDCGTSYPVLHGPHPTWIPCGNRFDTDTNVKPMTDLDQDALTAAHVAVEDELVEMRDSRMSVLGPANGLIIKERNGSWSDVMRMGTRDALRIGITAYLAAVEKASRS